MQFLRWKCIPHTVKTGILEKTFEKSMSNVKLLLPKKTFYMHMLVVLHSLITLPQAREKQLKIVLEILCLLRVAWHLEVQRTFSPNFRCLRCETAQEAYSRILRWTSASQEQWSDSRCPALAIELCWQSYNSIAGLMIGSNLAYLLTLNGEKMSRNLNYFGYCLVKLLTHELRSAGSD